MDSPKHHWQVVNRGIEIQSNTPENLWFNACSYFKWCDENPIKIAKKVYVGKQAGTSYDEETPRPYTVRGLCLHCDIMEDYLKDIRMSKTRQSEYYVVVSKILYIIFVQQQELATIGVYNPMFTAKALALDKPEEAPPSAIRVEVVNSTMELSISEYEVLEKLESENGFSEETDS